MTLGTAILIIAVLYLIERHKLWKTTGKLMLGVTLLAALVVGGWYGIGEYRTWRLSRDIRKAQSLGLCTPTPATLPADFDFTRDHVWVPVLTPANDAQRCVDADKVSLEVPPNRIVLSPKDIAIWKAAFDPNAPYSSVPVQTQAGYDTCMKRLPSKSDPYAAIAVCIPVGATIPSPPSGFVPVGSSMDVLNQVAKEDTVQRCIAKSTPAGNQTALDEQRQWCEQHPDKPMILGAPTPDPAARFGGKTRQRVECYKNGKLVPDSFAQFGGVPVKCAPDEVQVNH
jgi:hypothetical protein